MTADALTLRTVCLVLTAASVSAAWAWHAGHRAGVSHAARLYRESERRWAGEWQRVLEAEQRRNEFLAVLAHELRGPVSIMTNAVGVLRVVARGNPQGESSARTLERQLTLLSRRSDDLLDASRLARGTLRLRKAHVDLADVVTQAVDLMRVVVPDLRREFRVVMPSEPVIVHVDAFRLAQAIANLLTNAWRFTPQGGRVGLIIDREDDEVVIRVLDNGEGIAAERLPDLFDLFAHADLASRVHGGLGTGLPVAKSLVTMHGGVLTIQSDGVGMGTVATIRLPFNAQKQSDDTLREAAIGVL